MNSMSKNESKDSVKISIKYLVTIRDSTGRSREEVGFSKGCVLKDVVDWLNGRYDLSLPNPQVMAILNGRGWQQLPAKMATEIKDGDVICLFPPIAGG